LKSAGGNYGKLKKWKHNRNI